MLYSGSRPYEIYKGTRQWRLLIYSHELNQIWFTWTGLSFWIPVCSYLHNWSREDGTMLQSTLIIVTNEHEQNEQMIERILKHHCRNKDNINWHEHSRSWVLEYGNVVKNSHLHIFKLKIGRFINKIGLIFRRPQTHVWSVWAQDRS